MQAADGADEAQADSLLSKKAAAAAVLAASAAGGVEGFNPAQWAHEAAQAAAEHMLQPLNGGYTASNGGLPYPVFPPPAEAGPGM